ncbi:polyketide cyclase [[Pantoea] beijingensis]|uniref:Polyketide cyclase n=1 Tax=[Pantoea] beijingensis TaxID=1324864 RepID=A0A443IGH4_9GAMM|nr:MULTISPECIES: polyketide cyclase [Erwiniaceae]RWR03166.1 polyketide cyclase [[Pantoea] beijingensis]
MLPSLTISQSIPRHWMDLYETIWEPTFFPKWASGLSQSTLTQEGGYWLATGLEGTVRIRFTPHNPLGVMDHWVDTGTGQEIYMPMRIIANQQGADVIITVYRQPIMSDEKFAEDIEWVTRDLQKLHALLTC